MQVPHSADDPSLLRNEPLRAHMAAYVATKGSHASPTPELVSKFVAAMQQDLKENGQASTAAYRWARLLFEDDLSEDSVLEATDGGKEFYTCFFKYQLRLHEMLEHGNVDRLRTYQASIVGRGIAALKLKDISTSAQRPARGKGRGKSARRQHKRRSSCLRGPSGPAQVHQQIESSSRRPVAEDLEANVACLPAVGGSVARQGPEAGVHSTDGTQQPDAAKPSKGSASRKKKKRKASSQKPPVITPSDASEDDKESPKVQEVIPSDLVVHRSKRVAASLGLQLNTSLGTENQAHKLTQKAETDKQDAEEVGIFELLSPLTSLPSDDSIPCVKGERDTELPSGGSKHYEEKNLNDSTKQARTHTKRRKKEKTKSSGDTQANASKRLRRASISVPGDESGERSKPTRDEPVKDAENQKSDISNCSMTQKDTAVQPKARKKRPRLESGIEFVVPYEDPLDDAREPLGPDPRPKRPLPQKVSSGRSVPALNDDTVPRGVICGASFLERADQLAGEIASGQLVALQDESRLEVEDWTKEDEEEENDVEANYLDGHDDDELQNVQDITASPTLSTGTSKPPVLTPPPIWARSRQEVCESLEYFRCYHGGVYSKDDIVKGYLLGAYAASRDVFHHDGKLIISHGGGKSESILEVRRGVKRYQTDQDQEASDKSVRALLKTCKDRRPIALLADDKYALFPYDLASPNYTYVVLGLYWISHAWAERQPARDGSGHIVRWKFAFQWCEGQGNPWWIPQMNAANMIPDPPKPTSHSRACSASASEVPKTQCESCQERSPFIYQQGWMCLNPYCAVFWSINDGDQDPKKLDYREEFLALSPQNFTKLPNLIPTRPVKTPSGVTTTFAFSKGWYCPKCGRLSCRYKWEHWECANCNFQQEVKGRIRTPREFWHQRPAKGYLHSQIGKDSGIVACRLEPLSLGLQKGFVNRLTFVLPRNRGKIHLILGSPLTNGEADNIFQLYQQQASTGELKLRRYPLHNHRGIPAARGQLLTNYFSQNSGEPYQYVGGSGNTVPFREAPECVQLALALIKKRSSLALHTDVPFNEILTAAYMERQKMSFHSDSEKELGPIVASLSLGSAALMHFRSHASVGDPKIKSPYALSLVLRHGDVLVMEGDGVQRFYEHTVLPMNVRIAATARCIGIN